jgi:outer membrane protein
LAEEQVKTAQTRLAEAQYDYKIPEAMLAYSRGGRSQLEIDSTLH